MPLPPPPPGPPPAQSRSQSAVPGSRTTEPVKSPPTRRPPPNGVSTLGPVPPTPADWVDQDNQQPQQLRGRSPGLTIDTESAAKAAAAQAGEAVASGSSSGGLARAGAVRLDKTIMQRRNESRTRGSRLSLDGAVNQTPLSDIMVPNTTTLSRRLTITKSMPRSGGGRVSYDASSSGEPPSSASQSDSRHSTPRAMGSAHRLHTETATPPFSPVPMKAVPNLEDSPSSVPKALPTPPPQNRSASSSQSRLTTPSESKHIPQPLPLSKQAFVTHTAEQFCNSTIERFQAFATKEALVSSDADRVRLFADFIVSESRIRRERYSTAIGAMGSEIFDLTRDLFRPMSQRRESGTSQGDWTPQSSEPNRSHRGSMSSRDLVQSNSAPPSAQPPLSPISGPPGGAAWATNYMPSLSPILSMSVSDNHDDGSSRGRTASRWWEVDSSGTPSQRLERSKRESKYMGVPKEAREALQWLESPTRPDTTTGSSDRGSMGEYPREKPGWHDQEQSLTPQPFRLSGHSLLSNSSPSTPNPAHLDVSRLVTLPPPYPRHHPAVNNNHPDLTATRTSVRALSDLKEIENSKAAFKAHSVKIREDAAKAAAERSQALRSNLQQEINMGHMTYAEAGAIEADSNEAEISKTKEVEKNDFEQFQSQVVMPLNGVLTDRIARATALFDQLAGSLFDDTSNTADMPQEEGDDKPELLEKLTLLKWIFEAREVLHRAIFDLLSDRNDRYREVVLTPYRLTRNDEKLRNAESFFAEDAAKRQFAFAQEVLQRTKEFQVVVEQNVMRGVEVQLSAFWDIAPALLRLLEKIPQSLAGFQTQIPAAEYDENPSYHNYPLQYLFSLLLHAEKSTYQFIESQTNLLCLLHEVKEALAHAKAKAVASEMDGEDGQSHCSEERGQLATRQLREESQRLTDDLKEKVRVVQDQWNSALGEGIKNVKERVGEWLLQTGGWDESLEDGGVGGA
jgi:hypothetical protein